MELIKKEKINPKVLIGVVYYDHIEERTLSSINKLIKLKGFDFTFIKIKSASLVRSRNILIKNNIQGFDYFLGIDADIEFELLDFLQLYQQNKPAVFGSYLNKQTGFIEAGYFVNNYIGCVDRKLDKNSCGAYAVDFSGLGFYLLTKKCIDDVGYPLFDCPVYDKPDGTKDVSSEDNGFCMRLKSKGIDIILVSDVFVKHLFREDEKDFLNNNGIYQLLIPEKELQLILNILKKSQFSYEVIDNILRNIAKQIITQTKKVV